MKIDGKEVFSCSHNWQLDSSLTPIKHTYRCTKCLGLYIKTEALNVGGIYEVSVTKEKV